MKVSQRVWFRASCAYLTLGLGSARAVAEEDPGDEWRPSVALETATLRGARFVANLESGGEAELTLDPTLQKSAEDAFAAHRLPLAAAAVLSIADGKVLVLAGRSQEDPSLDASTLAVQPWAPAASVFKVIAAASLLQEAHVDPQTLVCYHGGVSAVLRDNLIDIPAIDNRCANLGYGIGKSQNAVIAKLASRNLTPEQLERTATAFGFGRELAFDAALEASDLDVPRDPLEFARAAAGFWHSSLSPLHGTLIAATIANHGVMPAAHIIDRAVDAHGHKLRLPKQLSRRVLDPAVAGQLGRMMQLTTSMGTAKKSFRDGKGRPYLPIEVAGKTGTLFYRGQPGDPTLPGVVAVREGGTLGYNWFVGFAPADRPRIAFAVLLANAVPSHLRAHALARQLIDSYLVREGIHGTQLLARR